MVDYAFTAKASFDASHTVPGYPGCSALHGHTWRVSVSVGGPLEPDENGLRRVALSDSLENDLRRLMEELDERDLVAMLPGVVTTPEGVAAWILERLPAADFVEVEMGWRRSTGRANRNKRR